jgi:hypothetical protein
MWYTKDRYKNKYTMHYVSKIPLEKYAFEVFSAKIFYFRKLKIVNIFFLITYQVFMSILDLRLFLFGPNTIFRMTLVIICGFILFFFVCFNILYVEPLLKVQTIWAEEL